MSQEDQEVRAKIRGFPQRVASDIFQSPEFQSQMNAWMIRTHIMWGISLAATFVGLNEALIWLQQSYGFSNFEYFIVFTPIGIGYLLWQYLRYPYRKRPAAS